MADEIVNKLGFSVEDALRELQRLDNALANSGLALRTFGGELDAWNDQAAAIVTKMKAMATAANQVVEAMKDGGGVTMPAAQGAPAAAASPGLWLPQGVAEEANKLKTALSGAGAAGADAGGKIKTGMGEAGNETEKTNQRADHLRVTFGTMGRIVVTQMIVRAMSQIRDALHGAVEESIEFQRRIAEVQTIAPQLGGSFGQLTNEAVDFARQWNIPLGQATEGLYQTISNQFTGLSERANVMNAAVKLARVGVMDFQDAILLITGTLNAYGMTSEQADSVAAKFFTTIRLGRVRGKELADTMGQVMPIASELGISLNEVNSAMIALTIGGLDAHKSVTGLRGAMTALLKPSTDMQKVIREMGFSSAEELVQAKGLQGALQAVADASDNMASQIGKSVRNVRALTAELRLTQSGAKQVEDAMKAMETSTPDVLNRVYKQFTSTDSEKLTSSINRLKITLTRDFGASLTGVLASMMQFVGGADRLAAAIQAIAAACVPAGVALMGLAAKGALAALALGPVGWTILGITAALSIFAGAVAYSTAQSINETHRLSNEQRQATLDFVKNKEEELRVLRETEEKKAAEEIRSWANRSAAIRRDYFKALDQLRDKNKDLIESDRQVMQSMISSQERVVAAYRNAANAALRMVQESQNRRTTLEGQYADLLFQERTEKQLQLDTDQKALATLRRSWELEAQANKALASAQQESDVQRAQALQQRADAFLKEGTALAKEAGDSWLIYQAEQSIRTNLEGRIAAERKLEQLQAARAQSLAAEAAAEQQRLDTMKSLMKGILADLQAFDKHGAKTPQELAKQQADLTDKLSKFQAAWMGGKKVDVADLLAFDQLQRRVTMAMEGGVSNAEISRLWAAPETFAKFRKDIEAGIGPIRVMIDVGRIGGNERMWEATKGMNAEETLQYFTQEMERTQEIINRFNQGKDAIKVANVALQRVDSEVQAAMDRWLNTGAFVKDIRDLGGVWEALTGHVGNNPLVRQARDELIRASKRFLAPDAKPSLEDLDKLKAAYDLYLGVIKPGAKTKEALDEFMGKAQVAVDAAKRVDTLTQGLNVMEAGATEAMKQKPALENALKAAEEAAKRAKESTQGAQEGAEAANKALMEVSQINMGGLVNQVELLADAMWSAAAATQNMQIPQAAPGPVTMAAHGGSMWKFFAGGGPVGTDVIPAMLSPGEVVINAASARRFAAQLTAINAGVQPVYRSEGGSVTNIGDINVTVNGGGTSRQTARSIAAELRRELRRGTATL